MSPTFDQKIFEDSQEGRWTYPAGQAPPLPPPPRELGRTFARRWRTDAPWRLQPSTAPARNPRAVLGPNHPSPSLPISGLSDPEGYQRGERQGAGACSYFYPHLSLLLAAVSRRRRVKPAPADSGHTCRLCNLSSPLTEGQEEQEEEEEEGRAATLLSPVAASASPLLLPS